MATFNLPNEGDFPWDLNPAITAINSEVEATTTLVTEGRLSEDHISGEIAGVVNTVAIPSTQKGAVNGVAPLDSSGDVPYAQLPDALSPSGVSNTIYNTVYLGNSNGASDVGPLIQSAYDAGDTSVTLKPGGTYIWDTPVFLDSTSVTRRLVVNLNGATIRLGANLPTTPSYRDATTKWAIFPNVKRSALSAGVVNVASNPARPGYGAPRGLHIYGGVIDGQDQNVGVSFAHTNGVLFESVMLYRARCLVSWIGYVDCNTIRSCVNVNPPASIRTDSYLLDQIDLGDGVLIDSCNGDAAAGIARLVDNHGATIISPVGGGFEFIRCSGISVISAHIEAYQPSRTKTCFLINRSEVTVSGGDFLSDGANRWAVFTVNDTHSEGRTVLTIKDSVVPFYFAPEYADPTVGSFIHIVNMSYGSEIKVDSVKGGVKVPGFAELAGGGTVKVTSALTQIQSALDAKPGLLATGTFKISGNAFESWRVDNPSTPGLELSKARSNQPPQPSILFNGATGPDSVKGTLTNGVFVEYIIAFLDEFGRYNQRSSSASGNVTAAGSSRIIFNTYQKGRVVVWRKVGGSAGQVFTAPDAYAILNCEGGSTRVYDTGANVNGNPWISTSVPVPNTVAGTNQTTNEMRFNNTTLTVP